MPNMQALREAHVARLIEGRGIRDRSVLAAMRHVPRELFVPPSLKREAYADEPLPIGHGQTISQPYVVALMLEALSLHGGEHVLEIGAGSGYAAALLGEIAGEVFSIERVAALAELAATNLAAAGCSNVHVRHANGVEGWAQQAPFDAILVSAGADDLPMALIRQLTIGGRMLVPVVRAARSQVLVRITRTSANQYRREDLVDVKFVPLIAQDA